MGLREKFEEKKRKKEQEVAELEAKIREAKSYIQALDDSLKLIPRDDSNGNAIAAPRMRRGSLTYRAHELLSQSRTPIGYKDILIGIGEEPNKKNLNSLRSSITAYARDGHYFKVIEPGLIGLVDRDYSTKNRVEDDWELTEAEKHDDELTDIDPF